MKNKFSEDLVQKSVFNKNAEEKVSAKRASSASKGATQYAQMLRDMEEERTKGCSDSDEPVSSYA